MINVAAGVVLEAALGAFDEVLIAPRLVELRPDAEHLEPGEFLVRRPGRLDRCIFVIPPEQTDMAGPGRLYHAGFKGKGGPGRRPKLEHEELGPIDLDSLFAHVPPPRPAAAGGRGNRKGILIEQRVEGTGLQRIQDTRLGGCPAGRIKVNAWRGRL